MSDVDDGPREVVGYVLVIIIAGVNIRDKVSIEVDDLLDLRPSYPANRGYIYERYGEETDYVEVRLDLIVQRELRPIYKDDEADRIRTSPLTPDEVDGLQREQSDEERVRRVGGNR